ncbi:MAG TPA: short-chain dehydrogenase/reductase, partial [Burkholderiales bacterium]|nr:short-chain dehydrogenase/reductase [Burkholderiales bacterium]
SSLFSISTEIIMELHLKGKTALVTGGSRGIGLGIARMLAEEGCHLELASRSEANLGAARDMIAALAPHSRIGLHALDLGLAENCVALSKACPQVDILINNAGAIPQASLGAMDEAAWRAAWELKMYGFINLTREVFRGMCERKRGVIVNIVGIAGERPRPDYLAGSMANAALMAMTRGLGVEGSQHGVRVVGINPGNTETDRQVVRWKARAQAKFGDENRWRELTAQYPQGRLGSVEEIAATAVFLCSDRSSYTNATVLTIDGGWSVMQ